MRSFVGIATSGRANILAHALEAVAAQSVPPEKVIICTPAEDEIQTDLTPSPGGLNVKQLQAPRGSCSQRNAILDELRNERGLLLIIDDDFILAPDYLERLGRLLQHNRDVAIINGALAADGISGPGLRVEHAKAILETAWSPLDHEIFVEETASIYGCNMGINLEHVHETRFDEALPLYAWQEDIDFSRRLRHFGRVARTNLLAGVHLGVKSGRTSGVRFGYSQVANPLYLVKKGTMSPWHAGKLVSKNIAKNLVRSFKPELYIDRRGRLKGNLIAFADLLRRRLTPERILRL